MVSGRGQPIRNANDVARDKKYEVGEQQTWRALAFHPGSIAASLQPTMDGAASISLPSLAFLLPRLLLSNFYHAKEKRG